jgi:hypothetical protein
VNALISLLGGVVDKLSRVSYVIILKDETNLELPEILSRLSFDSAGTTISCCLVSSDSMYLSIDEKYPVVLPGNY